MSFSAQQTARSPAEVWSAGDYVDVADRMIPRLGARLVELARVGPGDRVLDVAAGSGNAALPAARVGAAVAALDITPALLQAGAERARAAGLEIDWVHGDAQALPFPDASFDCVMSCVGVQFCADRDAAAAELVRVCRPGGSIALIAWTREGFIGQVLAAVARASGTATGGPSPLDWGSEETVCELLGPNAQEIAMAREHVDMPGRSPAEWVDYMAAAYGPLVIARSALERRGTWDRLRVGLTGIAATHASGDGEDFVARAEYLTVLMRRA